MRQHLQNKARATIFFGWFCCIFLSSAPLHAGDPDISYRTLKTAHFNIHHDVLLEKLARQVAVAAENAYILITTSLGWQIEGVVEMRIVDSTDYANGMASPYRYPYIELYATPSDIDVALQFHDDYLFTLVLHELTHIAHMQMQYGVSRVYNTIFGDLYLPNSMQPTWFIEGLAVLLETEHTHRGRIRSPYYSMVIRTQALEGTFQSLAQASNSTSDYPRGDADYIYGAMFLHYLEQRFGVQTIFAVAHKYAAQPIPFGLNRVFEEVTGVPLSLLYEDWSETVREESLTVAEQIISNGQDDSERLTFSAESKGHPILFDDTDELVLPIGDGLTRGSLAVLSTAASNAGAEKRRLVRAGTDAALSVNARGDMYYVRTAPYKDNYRFRDMFVLPKGEAEPRRLTFGKRIKEGAVSLSGEKLVVVTNRVGRTKVELLDGSGTYERDLLPAEDGTQYYAPVFSPDGSQVALVVRQGARVDLALVDVRSGKWFFATADEGIERSLRYSADGRYLLFASDVSGVLNIYAREMTSGQLKQVTNVTSGAICPALSADNRTLYFLKYYSAGWDLHRMEVSLDELPMYLLPSAPVVTLPKQFSVAAKDAPYNPLPSFRPHAWEVQFMGLGTQRAVHLATYWEDAAVLHQMSMGFDYEFSARNPSLNAVYLYNGLLPQFQLQFSYSRTEIADGYLVNGIPAPWTRENYTGQVGFSIPLYGLDDNHNLSLGYTLNEAAPVEALTVEVDPNGELPEMPAQYFRTGVRIGWSYSDLFGGPLSISREDGRSVYAAMTLYHPALGGNREQIAFSWAWREYRLAPWKQHHVFALELDGEAYVSNPNHQSGIYAGGYAPQPLLDAMLNERTMGLPKIRGYMPDSISGDHFHALRLEYRFPVWRPEIAYQTLPIFFRYMYGALFSDHLLMSYDNFDMDDYYASVGAELVWSFYLGYHMPVQLRTGFARGLMEHGENEFIMVIGGTY